MRSHRGIYSSNHPSFPPNFFSFTIYQFSSPFLSKCSGFVPPIPPQDRILESLKFKIERGKSSNFERTLFQNYRAYSSCTNINGSHLLRRFRICLTLYCSFYGSRVINVFAKSLKNKIHPKVERRKSSNFERSLCQNYRSYNSCRNINGSHLLRRFQICLTLFRSYYGSRVINVFAKSLKLRFLIFHKPLVDGATSYITSMSIASSETFSNMSSPSSETISSMSLASSETFGRQIF